MVLHFQNYLQERNKNQPGDKMVKLLKYLTKPKRDRERREAFFRLIAPIIKDDFVHESKLREIGKKSGLYNDFCSGILYSPTLAEDLNKLWLEDKLIEKTFLSFENCNCCEYNFPTHGPAWRLTNLGKIKLGEVCA